MGNHVDKSLFFLILSMGCIWLILDQALGAKRLQAFLYTVFPFMSTGGTDYTMTVEEVEEAEQNAPSSSVIGSSDNMSAMEKDNPYFYSMYTGKSPVPYAPALQAKYIEWLKKWGVKS